MCITRFELSGELNDSTSILYENFFSYHDNLDSTLLIKRTYVSSPPNVMLGPCLRATFIQLAVYKQNPSGKTHSHAGAASHTVSSEMYLFTLHQGFTHF